MEPDRTLGGKPRDGLDRSGRNNRHPCTFGQELQELAVCDPPRPNQEAGATAQVEHQRVHGAVVSSGR